MADTARELFEHELRDIYDAEHKLVRALESMTKKVTDDKLAQGLQSHRDETKGQIKRLEQVFELAERSARREPCTGINGLIEEFTKFSNEEDPSPEVLNVFATAAAIKTEYYEICSYTSLIKLARGLGLDAAVPLLEENLKEEQAAAQELEQLSDVLGDKLALGS